MEVLSRSRALFVPFVEQGDNVLWPKSPIAARTQAVRPYQAILAPSPQGIGMHIQHLACFTNRD